MLSTQSNTAIIPLKIRDVTVVVNVGNFIIVDLRRFFNAIREILLATVNRKYQK